MATRGALIIRIAGDTRDLGKATAKAGKQLEGVAKAAGLAGVAAGAALAAGVLGSMNVEKANDKLAAQLGLSTKKSAQIGKIAGDLYKNAYGDSIEGVNDAVAAVMTSIDGMGKASGKELKAATATALDFASAMNVDVTRASQVAGQVVRTGLAKNATEAFDLMTAASHKVPAALREDVLDAADEYGQFFAGIGMNGKQTFAALVKGAEKGQFGIDKIGDAVKEFTIRSSDMSTSSKDAYEALGLNAQVMSNRMVRGGKVAGKATQEIVKGLLSMKPGAKQANAAIALFGTPLEDLSVQEIPAFLKQLQGAEGGLGKVAGASKRMGDTLNDNASTDLLSFQRQVKATFVEFVGGKALPAVKEIAASLAKNFGPALKSVSEWMSKNQDIIVPLAAALGTMVGVIGVIVGAIKVWTAVQAALNFVMAMNPIGLIVILIAGLVAGLIVAYKKSETFRKIVDGAWAGIKAAVKAVVDWWTGSAWPAIKGFFEGIGRVVGNVIDWVKANWPLLLAIITGPIGLAVMLVIKHWKKIKGAFLAVWNWIKKNVFGPIKWYVNLLVSVFKFYGRTVKAVWQALGRALSATWGWIKRNVIDRFVRGWQNMVDKFKTARDRVGNFFSGMRDRLARVASWIREKVFGRMRSALGTMRDAFRTARDKIGDIWNGLKKLAARPINFVLGTVYNKGIRAWVGKIFDFFGKSNPLPEAKMVQFAKGSEDHRAQIARAGAMRLWAEPETGGEAYIPLANSKRPRSTQILANVASRFGYGLQKYANGGFSFGLSDALKFAGDTGGWIKDKMTGLVSDKFGASRKGGIWDMLREIPGTIIKNMGGWAKDKLGSLFGGMFGSGGGGNAAAGMGWKAMWDAVKGAFPTANLNSAYRPGAVTAVGTPSYHGMGRAIDVSPSMKIFDWIAKTFPFSTELIYSPAGGRQLYKGRPTLFGEPTRGDHWDHVHWAMKNGGLFNKVPTFDNGGTLGPGMNLVNNATGRPEHLSPRDDRPIEINLHMDSKVVAKLLVDPIREIVRVRGGGDVQATFGRGKKR